MCALLPLAAVAQQQQRMTFSQLQKKYTSRDGYTTVRITADMLKLVGMDEVTGVAEIRIVSADRFSTEFRDDTRMVLRQPQYKLLTEVEDKEQKALFYYRRTPEGTISRFVMAVWGEDTNMIMSISGAFSMGQLQSIAKQVSPMIPSGASKH